jgi:hypothetical protein
MKDSSQGENASEGAIEALILFIQSNNYYDHYVRQLMPGIDKRKGDICDK